MNSIKLDVALIHYPVCNKNGEIIGSAVTNLDIHDIARASRTFGVDTFYIVTPYEDQQELVREIVDHWLTGYGASYNSKRKEALSVVRICRDLDELNDAVLKKWGKKPTVLATCAKRCDNTWTYGSVKEKLQAGNCFLVLFGTGWGLAPEVMNDLDGVLPPIIGQGDYNHLSVRSAASIVLDRILGS